MRQLRVLFVTSEVFPLAKTGGLADVSAALPAALSKLGAEIRLIMPAYPEARTMVGAAARRTINLGNLLGAGETRLVCARMPDSGLPVWLVDCPALFAREGGLYQDKDGQDWPDNALRFAVLNHVAWQVAMGRIEPTWRADVVHCNDWHAGLLPLIAASEPGPKPGTVFTIHNLAFQGLFPYDSANHLGLSRADDTAKMEFFGKISFMKAGIAHADRLTTVSPTYAREILTPDYGCGFDGLLRERAPDLTGILNGADYAVWEPSTDSYLSSRYDRADISGKRVCKAYIQAELGLDPTPDVPLISFLSRIAHQKMADVVAHALPRLMERDVQFALIAGGDRALELVFQEVAASYPGRIAVRIGYKEPVAHRLQAGADLLLHPSRFEPCGLAPMYAMRYGTLPIVRRVGGQVDVVVPACREAVSRGTATGFNFAEETEHDMMDCIDQAVALYRQPVAWRRVQREAMRQNFDWQRSAEQYLALYRTVARMPLGGDFPTPEPIAAVGLRRIRAEEGALPKIRVASERP